ncbi:pullulanase [Bacillus sp. DJP31]|uniref:pullulanase n=1 Tax=Bacillus sp. DJP31 TaxID=3409789 RepID=UPI003BB6C64F
MKKKNYQRVISVFLSILLVVSMFSGYIPNVAAETVDRHISLSYERADGNYEDWNLWVWGTGVQDNRIDYTEIKDGKAIFNIAVGPDASSVGFIVRRGDWLEKDVEKDRSITVNQTDSITKVQVTSGVEEIFIVPDGTGPKVEEGNAHFYFRDKTLYVQDAMETIEKVELKILGNRYEMLSEGKNERFTYTLNDLPHGEHEYTYFVTIDGVTNEITDPYNTVEGKSVLTYLVPEVQVNSTIQPAAVNYNENAVVTVDLVSDSEVNIREMFIDLTAVGGENKVSIDPALNEITVAVDQNVTAGMKILPIVAIDEFGNSHKGEVTLEVKARTFTGEEADFDWDEAVVYFMLTDRFFDGDSSNNDPYGIDYDQSKMGTYQGGDFKGITQKLDYLDELGINTIWINPIVENIKYDVRNETPDTPYYAYHGYWANNFGELNPHFGSMEDFHQLIDQAHNRGMKIMVDVVLNHTGYGLKASDAGTNIPNFPTDEDRARFDGMLRAGGTDTVRGELAGLPDLITEDSAVRDQIVQWQVDWIEKSRTANGNTIDYFRVDTVKHVEDTTWMAFKNELTKEMPEFKLIGESWGASVNDDQGYLNTGMMDSLLDFDFKNLAKDLVNGQLEAVQTKLESRNANLSNDATLGQFLGSHDEDRFLEAVEGDLGKYQVAASLQMTAKGQPVIYYGEELGLPGKNNYPYYDNRPNLPWDQVEGNKVLSHYQKLLGFRSEYSDLFAKGDREKVAGSDAEKYLMFSRSNGDETVYVGLNTSDTEQELVVNLGSADAVVTDHYSNNTYPANGDGQTTITIPTMEDGGTVLLTVENGTISVPKPGDVEEIGENTLRIHYQRTDNSYENLGLWLWGEVAAPSENWPSGGTQFEANQITDYGAYVDVKLTTDAQNIGFLVLNTTNGDKDGGDKAVELFSPDLNEIWIKQGSDEVFLYEPVTLPVNTVRIHYDNDNDDYEGWGMWNWGDVEAPSDGWPNGAADATGVGKFGVYYDIKLTEDAKNMGFLFVNKQTGQQTGDRSFEMLDQFNTLFVKEGDDKVYTDPYGSVPIALLSGEVLSDKLITLLFSKIEGLDMEELASQLMIKDVDGNDVTFTELTVEGEQSVQIHGTFDLEKMPYTITYGESSITAKSGWKLIDEMYGYDGELGANLHDDGSATLKIWSPKADAVSVVLYDKDNQNTVLNTIDMVKGDRGVWAVTLSEDNTDLNNLRGYYYHYEITHGNESKLALDPYAKSMATWNSESGDTAGKAAIVDIASIGPELDYADIPGYEKREDAIIYEAHVRDFTSDPAIADDLKAQFGTFAAFIEKLDYIEEMGVTHIQLLPVMSYFFSDEFRSDERMLDYASTDTNYNWGYDPHNYFSLSGMYSENPNDPELRIEEFKRLIDEIHKRDMGVILDVVYNHTAQVSIFEDLVPNYYHFMDADGTPRTSFGGGRLGTTHKMARRVLEDSILHWVKEYKIDGFRFDMMGDHDAESIQIAFDKAKKLNPNIVMIGEGWRTFAGDEGEPVQAADQDWMQHTEAVGSFSDEFRNELKSGFGSEGQPRFLTGGARNIQQIFDNIKAQPHNFVADDPGDVVQYIAAHDNLTLYDVIAQSIKKDPDIPENNLEIHKRIRIGNAMLLTSQGTAFIHAGQEFGRTKQWRADANEAPYKSTYMTDKNGKPFQFPYFIHDSYDSSDIINRIDWAKATNEELYPVNNVTRDYTAGLIELRRSTDAFRLGSKELVDTNVTLLTAPEIQAEDLLVAYQNKATNGDVYYVFVNADTEARTLTLAEDLTNATVVVDQDEAGVVEVSNRTGFALTTSNISINPLTTIVIKVSAEGETPAELVEKIVVKGIYDKDTNIISIPNDTIERLASNGLLELDISELKVSDSKWVVELSEHQVQALRQKNGMIVVNKGDIVLHIPSMNFTLENGKVQIVIERYKDTEGALTPVYDFTIIQGETKIHSFKHPVTISFKVDSSRVNVPENVHVFYYNEQLGKWEAVDGEYKDGYVTGITNHFSTFTVFENQAKQVNKDEPKEKEPVSKEETKNNMLPDTATNNSTYLAIGMIITLIGLIFMVWQRKRRVEVGK